MFSVCCVGGWGSQPPPRRLIVGVESFCVPAKRPRTSKAGNPSSVRRPSAGGLDSESLPLGGRKLAPLQEEAARSLAAAAEAQAGHKGPQPAAKQWPPQPGPAPIPSYAARSRHWVDMVRRTPGPGSPLPPSPSLQRVRGRWLSRGKMPASRVLRGEGRGAAKHRHHQPDGLGAEAEDFPAPGALRQARHITAGSGGQQIGRRRGIEQGESLGPFLPSLVLPLPVNRQCGCDLSPLKRIRAGLWRSSVFAAIRQHSIQQPSMAASAALQGRREKRGKGAGGREAQGRRGMDREDEIGGGALPAAFAMSQARWPPSVDRDGRSRQLGAVPGAVRLS